MSAKYIEENEFKPLMLDATRIATGIEQAIVDRLKNTMEIAITQLTVADQLIRCISNNLVYQGWTDEQIEEFMKTVAHNVEVFNQEYANKKHEACSCDDCKARREKHN